jgi:hypothetical protein
MAPKTWKTLALVTVTLLAVMGASESVARAARQKVAVLGLEPEDAAAAKVASWATVAMRNKAASLNQKFEVPVGGKRDLAEVKLLSDCVDEKVDCMAQIGKDLGVERLLYGKVTHTRSGGYTLSLKYLDVPGKRLERAAYIKEIPAADVNEKGVGRAAELAFVEVSGSAAGGSIEIQANVDSGTVSIDGKQRGTIAGRSATIGELAEGTYNIAIESPGKKTLTMTVTVKSGEPSVVVATLEDATGGTIPGDPPDSPPLVPPSNPPVDDGTVRPGGGWRAAFWASLVVTAGGATAFTITGMKVRSLEDDKAAAIVGSGGAFTAGPNEDACSKASAEGYTPVTSICDDGKKYATMTNVFIGVTAVAAVAAGFFYYKGYIAPGPAKKKDVVTGRRRPAREAGVGEVMITPTIAPGGAGLGATITF